MIDAVSVPELIRRYENAVAFYAAAEAAALEAARRAADERDTAIATIRVLRFNRPPGGAT